MRGCGSAGLQRALWSQRAPAARPGRAPRQRRPAPALTHPRPLCVCPLSDRPRGTSAGSRAAEGSGQRQGRQKKEESIRTEGEKARALPAERVSEEASRETERLPGWLSGEEPACQRRKYGSSPRRRRLSRAAKQLSPEPHSRTLLTAQPALRREGSHRLSPRAPPLVATRGKPARE